jgi:hypothetical protein
LIDFLRQHPKIEGGESLAKCQNPPSLRGKPIKGLEPKSLACFEATPIDGQAGITLNCDTAEPARQTHWLYE